MTELEPDAALDRHALVMGVWLALGLIATLLLHYGLGTGGLPAVAAGFAAVLTAVFAHVIVNAVYATTFTRRELALGLVIYLTGLLAVSLAALSSAAFRDHGFVPMAAGLAGSGAVIVIYMIIHFGVRGVFDAFNVIGDFRVDEDDEPSGGGRQ